MILKVFISSTARDLETYRHAAREECVRVGLLPLDMKFFEAMAKGATAGSKQKLDEADLYLGIFAHRYGYVEEGYPASVTECEYDYAAERGLDRLCFLRRSAGRSPAQPPGKPRGRSGPRRTSRACASEVSTTHK